MAKDTNNIIYKVEVDTTSGKINIDGITKSFEQADKAFLKMRKDIAKGTKNVKNLGDATGSATSATMELSRVISDAPYGIRGMANNITQLVSQMGTASAKAGGFKNAIGLMIEQLMGPLGVVFAITAAVSALDYFAGSSKKAEDNTRGLKEELDELNSVMQKQSDTTKLATDNIREYLRLIADKRELDKTIADLDKEKVALDEKININKEQQLLLEDKVKNSKLDTTKVEQKLESVKKRGLELENQLVDIYDRGQIALNKYNETKKGLTEAEEGTVASLQKQKTELEKVQKQTSKTAKEYKEYGVQIDAIQKKIEAITGKDGKKGKRDKVSPLIDAKDLLKDAGKIIKITDKYNKKSLGLLEMSNVSRLMLQKGYAVKSLLALKGDHTEALNAISDFYDKAIEIEKTKQLESSVDLTKTPTSISAMTPEQMKAEKERRIEAMIETSQEIADVAVGLLTSSYDREIAIEQNKTNAMNNELRERLNNENLSAGERKRIQLEIARNDEAMRVKKEKLEKKAFNLQKTANIANALIQTYQGAQSAYVNTLKNPMNALDPKAGLLRAKINAGIATTLGLANVAMIAKQKFQSTAGATPTAGALGAGGSGSGGDRSFNFNLAGASRENQLANTLQGRFNQPLQAYVVGRDITNQQQLDEEITSSASFG